MKSHFKSSSARKLLPFLIMLAILCLTYFIWHHWIDIKRQRGQQQFNETVYDIHHVLTEELYSFEMVAKSLAGLLLASDEVTEEEFRTYCGYWGVPDRYQGMQFFAFAQVIESSGAGDVTYPEKAAGTEKSPAHPEENRSILAPITFIEPLDIFNSHGLRWNILEDDAWQAMAEKARDTGHTIMSDLLKFPAESSLEDLYGIVLFYPTYTGGMDLQSVEARQKSLQGYIITGVLPNELIEQCIPTNKKNKVHLTIYDVSGPLTSDLLYSDQPAATPHHPLYFKRETLSLYGRQLMFDFESTPIFEAGMGRFTSTGILIAGLIISLLAFLFVRTQENTRERALGMAKEMTSALQESERQFRLLAENTLDLIWQMDKDFIFTYVNPASESIFGFTPGEFVGTRLADYCSAAEINRIEEDIAGMTSQAPPPDSMMFETVFRHKNGREIPVEVHSKVLVDGTGRLRGFQGTTRDISERKRVEAEKKKLEAQFLQAQKMESVGRLAGGVAHDFNNMLTIILGYTEMLLLEMDSSHSTYQKLKEIHDAAERSSNLTQQLLAFARKQTVEPRVLNLNDTVRNTLSMMERLIGENIHLSWIPGPDLWPVCLDPAQIDQILANLCVNARDAISDEGNVHIETKNVSFDEAMKEDHPEGWIPGEYVLLEIRDDGCGMDKAALDKLFEPFFTTKVMGKGTGLGLATVYGIVKQNNGFIDVASGHLKGTTFAIYLPRYHGEIKGVPDSAKQNQSKQASEVILLVEDEPSILEMTQRILESQSYTVITAQSPEEAIRRAREYSGTIHLLITDVVMPGMNGHTLSKKLHSMNPRIRCLYISGYTADIIAHHGVVDEHMHFIQKPFSINQLKAKVREILDNKANTSDQD